MQPVQKIPLHEIRAAQRRIARRVVRTPLVRLNVDPPTADSAEVYLKLENLQVSGAFKVRGALNAMLMAEEEARERGVWTVSSGNMAVAVAYGAHELGVGCTVLVADDAPQTKLAAIRKLGNSLLFAGKSPASVG